MIYTIYYPIKEKKISEFEVQSDLYQELKKLGFNVKGEVKAKYSRLDIVVFDNLNNARIIIEVKSRLRPRATIRKYKRVQKYEELFNLPVLVCINHDQIDETIKKVKELFNA